MPAQTARQAAVRSPGRPRREIRVAPARVAEVFSAGFSPACLTTARAEANRDRSPVSAKITAAPTADSPSMLVTSPVRPSSSSTAHIRAPTSASRASSDRQPAISRCTRSSAPRRCALTPPASVSASHSPVTILW